MKLRKSFTFAQPAEMILHGCNCMVVSAVFKTVEASSPKGSIPSFRRTFFFARVMDRHCGTDPIWCTQTYMRQIGCKDIQHGNGFDFSFLIIPWNPLFFVFYCLQMGRVFDIDTSFSPHWRHYTCYHFLHRY